MTFFYMWGSALGPVIAGHLYDRTQTFSATLWGVLVLLAASSVLTALLIKGWSIKVAPSSAGIVPEVARASEVNR
jgi:hypothetical protein